MKKSIITILIIAIALVGWHALSRWRIYRKLNHHPDSSHRMSVVPEILDLDNAPIMDGTTTSVGYAEFILPESDTLILESTANGLAVVVWTDSIHIAFVKPFDPREDPFVDELKQQLEKLPTNHDLRHHWFEEDMTFLDYEILLEKQTPDPFWRLFAQDKNTAEFNAAKLLLKGSNVGGGMNSVYTYETQNTRGQVRVGNAREDSHIAVSLIENQAGTVAVGIIMRRRDVDTGDIMPYLITVLSSLRFTTEHIEGDDHIRTLIELAGIEKQQEYEKE